MPMHPTKKFNLRLAVLALLGVVLLLVSACDAAAPPMVISNATNDMVILEFWEEEGPRSDLTEGLRFAEDEAGNQFVRTYSLPLGSTVEIVFAGVLVGTRYPLVVSNAAGDELFRRTFSPDELNDRDWRITITPEGIR